MEIYTIYIPCTVYCVQIFPLEAKLHDKIARENVK